jgi:S-adenosylmethionine:tRNA ribosyltransferase-isomerase
VYTRSNKSITHHQVKDLPSLLPPHTTLVANRSKVRKGRLQATRSNGKEIELLVLEPTGDGQFECMVRGKNLQPDEVLKLHDGSKVTILHPHAEADFTTYIVDFSLTTLEAETKIQALGATPLPPYITESQAPDERYQTVFAKELGSAAAPTAGLHFTPELIAKLKQQGHTWEEITLHVGMGTFQPLKQEEVETNTLHHEHTFISEETAAKLTHPILAVGTTSCRTLESHATPAGIQPGHLSTNLFIYPGYQFQTTDLLFTNFHLPKSSLLLLVAALISSDPQSALSELHRIYEVAIADQYRFFSFGDAMLIR